MKSQNTKSHTAIAFADLALVAVLMVATVVGLAGVDLILPAIPDFPALFGSTPEMGQGVIAAFVGGYAGGLFVFGLLSDVATRKLLLGLAFLGFALTSVALVFIDQPALILVFRILQGACAAAPAVFTPSILKAIFPEHAAIKALGVLSSVEALAPAGAPVIGFALYAAWGWSASFVALAGLGVVTLILFALYGKALPERQLSPGAKARTASYARLMRNRGFLGHGLSQAAAMGGLLIFVFSAPVLIHTHLGGTASDFILMQIIGIAGFILAANASSALGQRIGMRALIHLGTGLCAVSGLGLVIFGALSHGPAAWLIVLFFPFNVGLGLRGPSAFLWALKASNGADDRASSLIILAAMGLASVGTALIAPLLPLGAWIAPLVASGVMALSWGLFAITPSPGEGPAQS
ncbi:MFS transporter [Woodsholea maritima]|uniref:MFS transporter n=1 Tax=Woodsholea maritima TaxID=240237 RepID=UPI00036E1239|nr:MFS transporter [Woodsholea maritima]